MRMFIIIPASSLATINNADACAMVTMRQPLVKWLVYER